jgi:hypothetical protein
MEFLCGLGLSAVIMTLNATRPSADIVPLDPGSRTSMRRSVQMPTNADDSFWPDVSSSYSLENPAPLNPENRASRVFTEIVLFFGAIGALIFAFWAFLPGDISP